MSDNEERLRKFRLGLALVKENAQDALVIYASPDCDEFRFETNSRTWAVGAIHRISVLFDEMERAEAHHQTQMLPSKAGECHA